jgi:hypothetical protein
LVSAAPRRRLIQRAGQSCFNLRQIDGANEAEAGNLIEFFAFIVALPVMAMRPTHRFLLFATKPGVQ